MYGMGLSFQSGGDYSRGIRNLRDLISHGRDRATYGIAETVRICVEAPFTPDASIYVHVQCSDLYVVGFQNSQALFYFNDYLLGKQIANQAILGFSGHYNELGEFVSLGDLSKGTIDAAVAGVASWSPSALPNSREKTPRRLVQSKHARQILALILVIGEAARFFEVELVVRTCLDDRPAGGTALARVDTLANEWSARSKRNDPGVAVACLS